MTVNESLQTTHIFQFFYCTCINRYITCIIILLYTCTYVDAYLQELSLSLEGKAVKVLDQTPVRERPSQRNHQEPSIMVVKEREGERREGVREVPPSMKSCWSLSVENGLR
jgi:hypothetical protein